MIFENQIFSWLTAYLTAMMLGFVISIVPGPVLLLVIRYALARKLKAAIHCIIGLLLGEIIYIGIVIIGYHTYLLEHKLLFKFISLLGGIIIVLSGLKNLTDNKSSVTKRSHFNAFATSLIITLTNPAIIFLLIAALGLYQAYFSSSSILGFFISIQIGSFIWYCLLILIFYKLSGVFGKKILSLLQFFASILLVFIGAFIIFTAIKEKIL